MAELLRVENVAKSFGGLAALKDVDLVIHEGEIVGLIGPNGAGKTTLFNIITGIYPPTAGTVSFEGRALARAKKRAAWLAPFSAFALVAVFALFVESDVDDRQIERVALLLQYLHRARNIPRLYEIAGRYDGIYGCFDSRAVVF